MRLRPFASVPLALAVGLMAWLLLHPGSGESPVPGAPRVVGVTQLRDLSAALGHNLYWAGAPGAGVKLELTRQGDGQIYIRYLHGGGKVGDYRASFTTVGTYPVPTAFAALTREANGPAAITRSLPGGGLAYMSARHPTSVYLAWPGSSYEVEVFDPSPKHALDLVLSGAIAPIS
jgi:hypothetical protein